jgi:hypothetical protein
MKSLSIIFLSVLFSLHAYTQITGYSSLNGIAINGYDPVAYYTQGKAVKGSDDYLFEWSGSQWKFSSKANLDSFILAPQNYAPQYGGYCAYGCSENHKSPTDPNAWSIVNNKLYLNYNLKVKERWIKDTANRIKAADEYWPALNKLN